MLSRPDPASIVAETPDHVPLIYPPTPVCIAKYVGKVSSCGSTPPSRVSWAGWGRGAPRFKDDMPLAITPIGGHPKTCGANPQQHPRYSPARPADADSVPRASVGEGIETHQSQLYSVLADSVIDGGWLVTVVNQQMRDGSGPERIVVMESQR